jgi:DNA polymerase-3 subunit gamma/tau
MLGLADRGRVLDIFEKLMGGDVPGALADLKTLYDAGADPLAVIQDLLETVHFLTRVKVAPNAQGFFDGGSGEAKRAATLAGKLSVAALTRAWQILMKGLFEVRDATRPILACEMVLIRLAYAAELPPTDKLVKDLLEGGTVPVPRGGAAPSSSAPSRGPSASLSASPARAAQPAVMPEGAPTLRTLEDIVALAAANNAPILKVALENYVHLVRLEAGHLEFRPHVRAPRTLAGDLQQKLKDWTGMRWAVSIASSGGALTLAEQKQAAKTARFEIAAQEPMVRAVLDRFPGAEIVSVRDIAQDDIAAPMPDADSDT